MIIEQGEKVHVIARRSFETDLRRHFVGEVVEAEGVLLRAEGYTYVLDTGTNRYIRRPEKRIRILSLTDALNIINVLPADTALEQVKYEISSDGRMIVTDGNVFQLDINEFGISQ